MKGQQPTSSNTLSNNSGLDMILANTRIQARMETASKLMLGWALEVLEGSKMTRTNSLSYQASSQRVPALARLPFGATRIGHSFSPASILDVVVCVQVLPEL
eukprot:1307662-Amphidinium_carterae.1